MEISTVISAINPDATTKQSLVEDDMATTIPSSFNEDIITGLLDEAMKENDISSNSIEMSTVVSATNTPPGNVSFMPNPLISKPSVIKKLEDKTPKHIFSIDEPMKAGDSVNQIKEDFSPFLTLNGDGDLGRE